MIIKGKFSSRREWSGRSVLTNGKHPNSGLACVVAAACIERIDTTNGVDGTWVGCNTGYPGSVHTNQDIFKTAYMGGSRGRVQGVLTPPPPRDDLWLPNTVIQNLLYRLIYILSSSRYFIAWSKVFFFVFDVIICLRHQSVTPFLSGALPPKKNPESAPGISFYPDSTLWWGGGGGRLKKMWTEVRFV